MSGPAGDFQNGTPYYLDATQQDLLLAALASNNQDPNDIFAAPSNSANKHSNSQFQYPVDHVDPTFFASPQQSTSTGFGSLGVEESPFADFLDGDTGFDFDKTDGSDRMIGALPGDAPSDEQHEKRKSPDDDGDEDEGGGKRREGEDKKKPGRKPLTSEPTTKRKAQNRAAQRAFRERKEKHLKDLETKVQELEKASDATNNENSLLRGQVQRLQMELREYRKRLSLNSTGMSRPAASSTTFSSMMNNTNSSFQFDFPRFGGLPGTHMLGDQSSSSLSQSKAPSLSSGIGGRHNSAVQSLSPRSSGAANSPDNSAGNNAQRVGNLDHLVGLSQEAPHRNSTSSSTASNSRVFQFNGGSSTHSGSPSVSSTSPTNQDSSCGTSPESSHQSPGQPKDTLTDGYQCHGNSEVLKKAKSPGNDPLNGIDYFATPNGGQFDPTLFGDYRDTNNAIVGDGDFTGGFFNDAFLNAGYDNTFHFGDTPAVQRPDPLEQIERIQDAEEEVVPGEDTNLMLNCHKIWDKLSNRSDFKDGSIDIDNLCSELRAKARCSESGVVVNHNDVEAALKKLPKDARPQWI